MVKSNTDNTASAIYLTGKFHEVHYVFFKGDGDKFLIQKKKLKASNNI